MVPKKQRNITDCTSKVLKRKTELHTLTVQRRKPHGHTCKIQTEERVSKITHSVHGVWFLMTMAPHPSEYPSRQAAEFPGRSRANLYSIRRLPTAPYWSNPASTIWSTIGKGDDTLTGAAPPSVILTSKRSGLHAETGFGIWFGNVGQRRGLCPRDGAWRTVIIKAGQAMSGL